MNTGLNTIPLYNHKTNNLYRLTTDSNDPLCIRILRTILYVFIHIITLGMLFLIPCYKKHRDVITTPNVIYPPPKLFPNYHPILDLTDPYLDLNVINNLAPNSLDALAVLARKRLAPSEAYDTLPNIISGAMEPNVNFLSSYPIDPKHFASIQGLDIEPLAFAFQNQDWINNTTFFDRLNADYYCIVTSPDDDDSFYRAYSIGWLSSLFRSNNPNAFEEARSHILSMPFYTHDQHASDQMTDLLKTCASYTHIQQLFDLCFLDPNYISKAINYFKALAKWSLINNQSLFDPHEDLKKITIQKLESPHQVLSTLKKNLIYPKHSQINLDLALNAAKYIPYEDPLQCILLILSTMKLALELEAENENGQTILKICFIYIELQINKAMLYHEMSFSDETILELIEQLPTPWSGLFKEFHSYFKDFDISPAVILLGFLLSYPNENLLNTHPKYSTFIQEAKKALSKALPKKGSLSQILSLTNSQQEEQKKLLEKLWQSQMSLCILNALTIDIDFYDDPLPGTSRLWRWYLKTAVLALNNHTTILNNTSTKLLEHINSSPELLNAFETFQTQLKKKLFFLHILSPQYISQINMLYLFLKKNYRDYFKPDLETEYNIFISFMDRYLIDVTTSPSSIHHDLFTSSLAYTLYLPILDVYACSRLTSSEHPEFFFSHILKNIFAHPELAVSNTIFKQYINVISAIMNDMSDEISESAQDIFNMINSDPWKYAIWNKMVCHHKKLIFITFRSVSYMDSLSLNHLVYLFSRYYLNMQETPLVQHEKHFRRDLNNYYQMFSSTVSNAYDTLLSFRGTNRRRIISGFSNRLLDILTAYDEEQQKRIVLLLKPQHDSLSVFHQAFNQQIASLNLDQLQSLDILTTEEQAAYENNHTEERILTRALSHAFITPAMTQLPNEQFLSSEDPRNFNSGGLGSEAESSIFIMLYNNHYICLLPRVTSNYDPLNLN